MDESSPGSAESPSRITRLLEALDRLVFRDHDLRATARGWQVRRLGRFQREYRDPRFDLISRCSTCGGRGVVGTQECPDCEGSGRTISRPDERVLR